MSFHEKMNFLSKIWHMKICKTALILISAVFLFTGCKIVPTKAYLRTGPSYANEISNVSHFGLLTDAVVRYLRVGTNYFVLADSKFVATNMLSSATLYLEKKGYSISFSAAPFIGAFEDSDKPMPVADLRRNKPTIRYAPFYVSDVLKNDEPYQWALKQVLEQVTGAITQKGNTPTEALLSDPDITNSLHLIAERNRTDYLMVIVGDGVLVSEGKQAGEMFGTAMVSTVLTAGFVTVMRYDVSYLNSFAGLVDLKTGEILWSNSNGWPNIEPTNLAIYQKGRWAAQLLYHLPDRAQLKSP
jgi:hypothetical protein